MNTKPKTKREQLEDKMRKFRDITERLDQLETAAKTVRGDFMGSGYDFSRDHYAIAWFVRRLTGTTVSGPILKYIDAQRKALEAELEKL